MTVRSFTSVESQLHTVEVIDRQGQKTTYRRLGDDVWRAYTEHGAGTLSTAELLAELACGVLATAVPTVKGAPDGS